MAYCSQCGVKNDDDSVYCKKCGIDLNNPKKQTEKDCEHRCEEECEGGQSGKGWSTFWGVIIILIGVAILFEFVLKGFAKNITWLSWLTSMQWSWVFAAVIALFIILFGVRILTNK